MLGSSAAAAAGAYAGLVSFYEASGIRSDGSWADAAGGLPPGSVAVNPQATSSSDIAAAITFPAYQAAGTGGLSASCPSPLPYLRGTAYAQVTLPVSITSFPYSVCVTSRLEPTGGGARVLGGAGTTNWLLGHYSGARGRAYLVNGWATSQSAVYQGANTDWTVHCVSAPNASAAVVYMNGADISSGDGGAFAVPTSLAVNVMGQNSAFGLRSVAVWNVALSPSQLFAVSAQMMADSCIDGAARARG